MVNDTSKTEDEIVHDQHDSPIYINVRQVCDILGRSEGSVRQLIARGKLAHRKAGMRNLEVSMDSVLSFYPRNYRLPSWSDNETLARDKKFILITAACERLRVAKSYVRHLIRQGKLEGYATSHGDIMVSVTSIDTRLQGASANANDL